MKNPGKKLVKKKKKRATEASTISVAAFGSAAFRFLLLFIHYLFLWWFISFTYFLPIIFLPFAFLFLNSFKMSAVQPVAVYALRVPPGALIPAVPNAAASVSLSLP
jgi:uncharacterized membrane protein